MKTFKLIPVMFALLLVFGLTSCNKDKDGPDGSFKVRMTDSPAEYESLDLEVTKVEAYSSTNGWITLSNQAQMVNVASLTNGAETELAFMTDVKAGLYTKLKVTFGTNNHISVFAGGSSGSLSFDLIFNSSREVEVAINEEVGADAAANVLLDFDIAASVLEIGNDYILQPAVTEIKDAETGAKGEVKGAAHVFVKMTGGGKVFSTYADANGKFLLRGMSPGTYEMEAMPSNPDDDPALQPQTLSAVVVTSGQIKNVGQINF